MLTLIWVTNDIWIAINLWDQVKHLQKDIGFKWFVYTPIDSYGLFPELAAPMMEWSGLATYTEFGAKELRTAGYTKHIDVEYFSWRRSMPLLRRHLCSSTVQMCGISRRCLRRAL